jgi:hypothetical protein
MNLKGHQVVKIFGKWLLDMTEYKVYRLYTDRKGNITSINTVCRFMYSNGSVVSDVTGEVPVGVVRVSMEKIKENEKIMEEAIYAVQ